MKNTGKLSGKVLLAGLTGLLVYICIMLFVQYHRLFDGQELMSASKGIEALVSVSALFILFSLIWGIWTEKLSSSEEEPVIWGAVKALGFTAGCMSILCRTVLMGGMEYVQTCIAPASTATVLAFKTVGKFIRADIIVFGAFAICLAVYLFMLFMNAMDLLNYNVLYAPIRLLVLLGIVVALYYVLGLIYSLVFSGDDPSPALQGMFVAAVIFLGYLCEWHKIKQSRFSIFSSDDEISVREFFSADYWNFKTNIRSYISIMVCAVLIMAAAGLGYIGNWLDIWRRIFSLDMLKLADKADAAAGQSLVNLYLHLILSLIVPTFLTAFLKAEKSYDVSARGFEKNRLLVKIGVVLAALTVQIFAQEMLSGFIGRMYENQVIGSVYRKIVDKGMTLSLVPGLAVIILALAAYLIAALVLGLLNAVYIIYFCLMIFVAYATKNTVMYVFPDTAQGMYWVIAVALNFVSSKVAETAQKEILPAILGKDE